MYYFGAEHQFSGFTTAFSPHFWSIKSINQPKPKKTAFLPVNSLAELFIDSANRASVPSHQSLVSLKRIIRSNERISTCTICIRIPASLSQMSVTMSRSRLNRLFIKEPKRRALRFPYPSRSPEPSFRRLCPFENKRFVCPQNPLEEETRLSDLQA